MQQALSPRWATIRGSISVTLIGWSQRSLGSIQTELRLVRRPGRNTWSTAIWPTRSTHVKIPSDWSTGYVPLNRYEPYQLPVPDVNSINGEQVFTLNARASVEWAFKLTSAVTLPDDANLQSVRAKYPSYPNALKPPFVLIGDTLSAGTFWSGNLLNAWAEKWVDYWTKGKAAFTTSAEEDAGILQALTFLAQAGKADLKRVLCCAPLATTRRWLRKARPPQPSSEERQQRAGFLVSSPESLNAAYLVGSPVVNEITEHWSRYEDQGALDAYKTMSATRDRRDLPGLAHGEPPPPWSAQHKDPAKSACVDVKRIQTNEREPRLSEGTLWVDLSCLPRRRGMSALCALPSSPRP